MSGDQHLGFYKHDNLPHFDAEGALQFVTFVLADAAPRNRKPRNMNSLWSNGDRIFLQMDHELDRGAGSCILRHADLAGELASVISETAVDRYSILAWVIMPNHIHLLFRQEPGAPLGDSVRLIKARSAQRINRIQGRDGKLWQAGYFDRAMRSFEHMKSTIEYIHENPVRAKLVNIASQWRFSSVHGFNMENVMEIVDPRNVIRR